MYKVSEKIISFTKEPTYGCMEGKKALAFWSSMQLYRPRSYSVGEAKRSRSTFCKRTSIPCGMPRDEENPLQNKMNR